MFLLYPLLRVLFSLRLILRGLGSVAAVLSQQSVSGSTYIDSAALMVTCGLVEVSLTWSPVSSVEVQLLCGPRSQFLFGST